jgi:flavin reductase (DIM6/NTAB) family NADH-FMN oxidoreductase RutF
MLKVKRQRLSLKKISSQTELPALNNACAATEAEVAEVVMVKEAKKNTMDVEIEHQASNASSEPKVVTRVLAPVHFLRACSFCQLGLGPGHDTFIYRYISLIFSD